MSLFQSLTEIEYPESDGQPMGETDLHRQWMIRLHDLLSHRYRGQRVYVACNLLVYYREGRPHNYVVPDNFVVFDASPDLRRTYKIWVEQKSPDVVFEVTSRSTRRDDEVEKPRIYAEMGVQELYLYDPTHEYLTPPLQMFVRQGSDFVPAEPDASGAFFSQFLDAYLRLAGTKLVLIDRATGQPLLTEAEDAYAQLQAKEAVLEAKDAALEAKDAALEAKDAALAEAAEEIRRLRERLREASGNGE